MAVGAVVDHEGLQVGTQESNLTSEADVGQVPLAYGGVDPAGPNREELRRVSRRQQRLRERPRRKDPRNTGST